MFPSTRLNELAQRKQLVLAQSDLHRELIAVEHHQLQARLTSVSENFKSNRWWLLGGVLGAGWMMTRTTGILTRWLPLAATAWNLLKKMRPH